MIAAKRRGVRRYTLAMADTVRQQCLDCAAPLFLLRRRGTPGVRYCADCQMIARLKERYYQGGAI